MRERAWAIVVSALGDEAARRLHESDRSFDDEAVAAAAFATGNG